MTIQKEFENLGLKKFRELLSDDDCMAELKRNNWTVCEKFSCEECPIELNCPFEQLLDADSEGELIKKGFTVLQGPGGMWGVFKKEDGKLRMLTDDEW